MILLFTILVVVMGRVKFEEAEFHQPHTGGANAADASLVVVTFKEVRKGMQFK